MLAPDFNFLLLVLSGVGTAVAVALGEWCPPIQVVWQGKTHQCCPNAAVNSGCTKACGAVSR